MGTNKDFFLENAELLEKTRWQNQIYREQPKRERCKLCGEALPANPDLRTGGIDYCFCVNCGHFNGGHQDTETFVRRIYLDDKTYSARYTGVDFESRAKDIYYPKADFLRQNLPSGGVSVLDIGCGGGYFVYACLQNNIPAEGFDLSRSAVEFGNFHIDQRTGKRPLRTALESDFYEIIINSKATVLSVIGVIEHLREPQKFFDAFERSGIRYLFYSVPMFSSTVLVENVFKDVFPRQLGADHTHLFTEESIGWMHQNMRWQSIAEWRFGTDVMDLYRSILLMLHKSGASDKVTGLFTRHFGDGVGEMQAVLDSRHFCSEIHCLVQKKGL
jgi:SAM-dependent methyltransferase